MKRLLLLTLALVAFCGVQAQQPVFFYGVDFMHCKVFSSHETPAAFADAFHAINDVLYNEADKYDFSRLLGRRYEYHTEVIHDCLQQCDFSNLRARSPYVEALDIESIVRNYNLPQTEGKGFVLIAKLLNKAAESGTYYLVYFDVASRQILYQIEATTEAGGFGLRNYWANTIHQICKKSRYRIPANL